MYDTKIEKLVIYIYIYIYIYVYMCVCVYIYIYIIIQFVNCKLEFNIFYKYTI